MYMTEGNKEVRKIILQTISKRKGNKMKEPIVIQKLKKLSIISTYANISYSKGEPSVHDLESGLTYTYPKTYEELLKSLDKRIAILEAKNGK
jgi:hypothetical protein